MVVNPLHNRDILKSLIEKHREQFYQSLPYFVENHSSHKMVPYVYSAELNDVLDAGIKSFRELMLALCVPHEEKEKEFDYWISLTPFSGIRSDFIRKVCQSDNLLDKRCIERWLSGKGKEFIPAVREVFVRIVRDHDQPESLCFLFLLTMVSRFNALREEFCQANLGKLSGNRKDAFFSTFFFHLTELIIRDYMEETKNEGFANTMFLELFSPLVFTGIKTSFFRNAYNYWGIGTEFWTCLEREEAYARFSATGGIPEQVVKDETLVEKGARDYLLNQARSEIFSFIADNYGKDEMSKKLPYYLYNLTHFNSFINSDSTRNDVFKLKKGSVFKTSQTESGLYEKLRAGIERIVRELEDRSTYYSYFEHAFANYVKFKAEEQFAAYIRGILAEFRDKSVDRNTDLKKEYESGKLYYFSRERKKLVNRQQISETAAIYMDIRDFTLKMFHLTEDVVLELLDNKFYTPLLRYAGSRKGADLQLKYVLGESILFSGAVEELVRLAAVVKKESDDYKHSLEHLILDDEKKQLMALDLGIFITYGPTPAASALTSEFGKHTLHIGDIINTCKRGARRDPYAGRMLDQILARESGKAGRPLQFPFHVNIIDGHSIAVPLNPLYSQSYESDKAVRILEMEKFFDILKKDMAAKSNQDEDLWPKESYMYNAGIALTQEALLSFLRTEKVYAEIKNARLPVDSLPGDIRETYLFRDKELELYLVRNSSNRELFLFRKEGAINLTGVGRDSVVWELVTDDMVLFKPLVSLIS